jgi:hypothetical protein
LGRNEAAMNQSFPVADTIYLDKGRKFFANFGLQSAESYEKKITFDRYCLILTVACRWHGLAFQNWVADCFAPEGIALDEDTGENTSSHYYFIGMT